MEELKTRFETALLLCRACGKRGSGPPKKDAKELARALRGAARDAGHPRPRVVLTSCLGACPKKAFTLAATRADGDVAMLAVRRDDDPAAVVAAALGPARLPPAPAVDG